MKKDLINNKDNKEINKEKDSDYDEYDPFPENKDEENKDFEKFDADFLHFLELQQQKGIMTQEYLDQCLEDNEFIVDGLFLFKKYLRAIDSRKKIFESVYEPIGPGVKLCCLLYNVKANEYTTIFKFNQKEYIVRSHNVLEEIQKVTKIPITDVNAFKKYILLEQIKISQSSYMLLIPRTGWHVLDNTSSKREVFVPFQQEDDNAYMFDTEHLFYEKLTSTATEEQKQKQHEIIKIHLSNATPLGILYLCALSSIFLKDLETNGFSTLVTGPKGVGKTTLATLACSLFSKPLILDANSTRVGLELSLESCMDLPLIVDEAALSTDERLQELIFMLSTGQGRKRGTIKLTVNFSKLRNIVFLTSERELEFTRLGAYRRTLHITLTDKIPLAEKPGRLLQLHGAGIDYIQFYTQNKFEILKERDNLIEIVNTEELYQLPILFSLSFIEKFYKENFSNTKDTILELFDQQKENQNTEELYFQKFKDFLSLYFGNFYRKVQQVEDVPKTSCFGFLFLDENPPRVLLIPEIFKKFCIDFNIDKKTFISIARHRGLLQANDRDYLKVRKSTLPYATTTDRFYCFTLPFDIEIDEDETEEPF